MLGSVENAVSWRWIDAISRQDTPNVRAASRYSPMKLVSVDAATCREAVSR